MIGINVDVLDKLIKVNNLNSEAIDKDIENLRKIVDNLSKCYIGKGVDVLFTRITSQDENLVKIAAIVKNYSDILINVKVGYEKQDANFQSLFNRMNM